MVRFFIIYYGCFKSHKQTDKTFDEKDWKHGLDGWIEILDIGVKDWIDGPLREWYLGKGLDELFT